VAEGARGVKDKVKNKINEVAGDMQRTEASDKVAASARKHKGKTHRATEQSEKEYFNQVDDTNKPRMNATPYDVRSSVFSGKRH